MEIAKLLDALHPLLDFTSPLFSPALGGALLGREHLPIGKQQEASFIANLSRLMGQLPD